MGISICFIYTKKFFSTSASATNCYYDKENMPDIKIRSEYIANRDNNKEFPNYADFGKTTSEMKTRELMKGLTLIKNGLFPQKIIMAIHIIIYKPKK